MLGKDENVDLYYSQTDADENGHYTIKLKGLSQLTSLNTV